MRTFGFGITVASVALLAAACGGASPSAAGGTSSAPATTATTATTTASAPASGAATGAALTLKTMKGSAGIWLTDASGRTLYLYTADKGTTSTCYNACATQWPPLTTTGAVTVTGQFTAQKYVGTTTRTDGSKQVTYGGHPLYYFIGDKAPGQTAGQAVAGVWFLIGPVGNVMK
jgi:predicted lipoprotein with Yx(FWY)xxD motif